MQETQETQVQPLGQEDPLDSKRQSTTVFLAGKFHGQRRLACYSPWGCKELDMTEHTYARTPLCYSRSDAKNWVRFTQGNGNPLQYSCLENPRDRRAWWAAVHGITKSWAQLSD